MVPLGGFLQELDQGILLRRLFLHLVGKLGFNALATELRIWTYQRESLCCLHRGSQHTFHSSARVSSSSSLQVSVPRPRRKSIYPQGKARSTKTSTSGASPPSGERLPRLATNGSGVKPSLLCQGARLVELPEMTS